MGLHLKLRLCASSPVSDCVPGWCQKMPKEASIGSSPAPLRKPFLAGKLRTMVQGLSGPAPNHHPQHPQRNHAALSDLLDQGCSEGESRARPSGHDVGARPHVAPAPGHTLSVMLWCAADIYFHSKLERAVGVGPPSSASSLLARGGCLRGPHLEERHLGTLAELA